LNRHWLCCVSAGLALVAFGCNSKDDAPAAPKPATPTTKTAPKPLHPGSAGKDNDQIRAGDPLVGRWVREGSPGKLYWHFAMNGEFFSAFDVPDKASKTEYPEAMRGATSYTGGWKTEGKELILTNVSGPSQPVRKEVRIPLKHLDDKTVIEIDGAKYKKG